MSKVRRSRRSSVELEADVLNALEELLQTHNIGDITLLELTEKADITLNVFYRHFSSIDDVVKKLARNKDFWFERVVSLSSATNTKDEHFYFFVLLSLYRSLKENVVMQRLLLWELTSEKAYAKENAMMRETLNLGLMGCYLDSFERENLDISCATSFLISALYYLVLHKDVSTFCGIDFASEEGDKRVVATLKKMVHLIFKQKKGKHPKNKKLRDFLREKGLSAEDIEASLRLIDKY